MDVLIYSFYFPLSFSDLIGNKLIFPTWVSFALDGNW